jgi:glycosyltransferase involved in cell wall biosynthesis
LFRRVPGDLEVLIITFNRAASLERTLELLAASPLGEGPVTVLDNASTDATPEVCARLAPRFADLRVVRHDRNLGGLGNFLRAIELARATYAWVLADDDDLRLDLAGDVLEAVADRRADLISVGAPGRDGWPLGTLTSARRLLGGGHRFFHVFTFIPNTIFRTALYDDAALAEGYLEAGHYYPHFAFLRRQVERDASVYVSRHDVVVRRGLSRPGSELDWFTNWVRNCETIADPVLRRQVVHGTAPTLARWIVNLGGALALERLRDHGRTRRLAAELLLLLPGRDRLLLAAIAPVVLLPRPVLRGLLALGVRFAGARIAEVEERPIEPARAPA